MISIKVNKASARRVGVSAEQVVLVEKTIKEEIGKIQSTLGFTHHIELDVKFSTSHARWGSMKTFYGSNNITRYGEMSLSKMTIEGAKYGDKLKDTVMHELLHLMPNGMNHEGMWKVYANKINSEYGYTISRCSGGTEYGIPHSVTQKKYAVKCPKCGHVWEFDRMCKVVKYPEQHACGGCMVHLERVR